MVGSVGPLGGNGGMFRHSIERMDPEYKDRLAATPTERAAP
jgi:hypothetical protein